jgi:hypothetical protein
MRSIVRCGVGVVFSLFAFGATEVLCQPLMQPIPFDSIEYNRLQVYRQSRAAALADSSAGLQALRLIRGVEYSRLTPLANQSLPGLKNFLQARGVPVSEFGPSAPLVVPAPSSESEVRRATVKAMRSDAAKLAAHFSLADGFFRTARAMEIVDPSTAVKIDRKLGLLENVTSFASAGLAVLGASAFLRGNKDDAGGWAVAASFSTVANQFLAYFGDRGATRQSNAQVSVAFDSAHAYASRLATNVFLTTQLQTLGGSTQIIESHADTIAETPADAQAESALQRARMYVLLFEELDNFYDARLLTFAQEIARRGETTNPVYTDKSKSEMRSLANEIRDAYESWRRARVAYEPSLQAAEEYIRLFGAP